MMRFVASTPHCDATAHEPSSACTYQVAWAINPHMIPGSVDSGRAIAQHRALLQAVRALGASVDTVPFVHGAFDSVFAKDNAVYAQHGAHTHALLGRARHAERRMEQVVREADLRSAGLAVDICTSELEGGDVIVVEGRCAVLGYGFRSSRDSVSQLSDFLGLPVAALELVDPGLYHLDTALTILADGTALVCDEAFTPTSRRALRALGLGDVLSVSHAEAMRFALNMVEVGPTIVTGTDSPEVTALLNARGRRVVYTPLEEFHRAGGSAACLLARIHDPAATASSSVAA